MGRAKRVLQPKAGDFPNTIEAIGCRLRASVKSKHTTASVIGIAQVTNVKVEHRCVLRSSHLPLLTELKPDKVFDANMTILSQALLRIQTL